MIDSATPKSSEASMEDVLRDALDEGDRMLGTVAPILGHLLANHNHSLFSDEIVARVRGMISHLASQLLMALAEAAESEAQDAVLSNDSLDKHRDNLAADLAACSPLLTHCHALAVEWQLAMQLDGRNAIDPVLSPLLQALIASDDEATASSAMTILAAQARFIQQQRRMELPLSELPGDLFHQTLLILRHHSDSYGGEIAAIAEAKLRADFDESAGRLGLISRILSGMGKGAAAALSVGHSGVSLFISALALASGQDREIVAVSTNDQQLARFVLALRGAGLKPEAVEEQLLCLHPDVTMPEGFAMPRAERAAAMLSASHRNVAG